MSSSLEQCIVRIFGGDGAVVGAGVLVSERYVVTCAHVVARALGRPDDTPGIPDEPVGLDFPFVGQGTLSARVAAWKPPTPDVQTAEQDLALLCLRESAPSNARAAVCIRTRELSQDLAGHNFRVYGFPRGHDIGVNAYGVLRDRLANGWLQVEDVKEPGVHIQPGFSGAPVWDETTCGVIGIVIASSEAKLGFLIPSDVFASVIASTCPELAFELHAPASRLGRLSGDILQLPPHFLPRTDALAALKEAVLGDQTAPVGITGPTHSVGVQGMGGIGKSVLAAALARDWETRSVFPDGVVWVTLGRHPILTVRQAQLAEALGEPPRVFDDEQQGRARLRELFADRACLLILDDVWNGQHAAAFDALGPRCRMLLTSRDAELIRAFGAKEHCLDVLSDEQAQVLLANWSGQSAENLPDAAREVIRECGKLPLALATVGAMVGNRPGRWENALHRLRSADLGKIQKQFPNYPYPNLLQALDTSVAALADREIQQRYPDIRARYLDLAVFPADTPVPEQVLRTFWKPQGLDEYDVQDVIDTLADRSLVGRDEHGHVTLHDLQHDYLRAQADNLEVLHQRILDAYAAECSNGWATGPDDGYFLQHLEYNLLGAGRSEDIKDVLLDFDWLRRKLDATDVNALMAAYLLAPPDSDLDRVRGAIQLSAHVLARDAAQLAGQLLGRLSPPNTSAIRRLLSQAKSWKDQSWLRPLAAGLTPPGGPLIRTLELHSGRIRAVEVTADGKRAFSRSDDSDLKIWDLESGTESQVPVGHGDPVVAVTPDGRRALSVSSEHALKVWDLITGMELRSLDGHRSPVDAVAVTPDGRRAISASTDRTLKVWDLETGIELHSLSGHTASVTAIAVTEDGRRAVSASMDRTLKVWDLEGGKEMHTLEGHGDAVTAVAVTLEGRRAVSASDDYTVKVWDLETGAELRCLEGHISPVDAVVVTADGRRAVSGSMDCTLKVWDLENGKELQTLEGHSDGVTAVAVTPDGRRALSASRDRTLQVWDLEAGKDLHARERHRDTVFAVAVDLVRRQAISASADHTLKVWDCETGMELHTLVGHSDAVLTVAVTPDGLRAVSGSADHSIKVWDLQTGREEHSLDGHSGSVLAVTVTPDGRCIVSASTDRTLKVWDRETGMEVSTLEGHRDAVAAVAVTPDGLRVISASGDRTVKVWDLEGGKELQSLEGHSDWIKTVVLTPDGSRAVSASDDHTLKIWHLQTGMALHTLEGHSDLITTVAVTPDGCWAVSGSADHSVKVWDLKTGKEERSLHGHREPVTGVAMTHDGRRVFSVSTDRTLRAWEVEGAVTIGVFTGDSPLASCAGCPDGLTVVVGEDTGGVHFLRLERADELS